MGNVAACGGCCHWIFTSEDGEKKHSKLLDEENSWFEHDKVPLVSARYDAEIQDDCVVQKTVVMRSPRATEVLPAFKKEEEETTSRRGRGLRSVEKEVDAPKQAPKLTPPTATEVVEESTLRTLQEEEEEEKEEEPNEADVQEEVSSPRSPKSPKSPKSTGSPKKKARYGRKNYRANSSRKKNV